MSHSIGGHCGKCGAIFWLPSVWHGVCPPPITYTCRCHDSTKVTISTGTSLPVMMDPLTAFQQRIEFLETKLSEEKEVCGIYEKENKELKERIAKYEAEINQARDLAFEFRDLYYKEKFKTDEESREFCKKRHSKFPWEKP